MIFGSSRKFKAEAFLLLSQSYWCLSFSFCNESFCIVHHYVEIKCSQMTKWFICFNKKILVRQPPRKQTCLLASVPERGSWFEAGGYWHQGWRRTKSEKQPKELICCQRFTLTSELHGWTHAAKSPIFWGSSDAPWRFFHLFILWKVSFFRFYYCFKERLIHFACIKL